MGMMGKHIWFIGALMLAIPSMAIAQERSTADLEREVRRLERELAQANSLVERAKDAGFIPAEESIASVWEIIACLPDELALNARTSWDLVQSDKARKLLEEYAIGCELKTKLKVVSVRVTQNPSHVQNPSLPKYQVDITLENKVFAKSGVVITQDVTPVSGFRFGGDEEIVEKAKKIRTGKAYEIRGVISRFLFARKTGSKKAEYEATMTLTDLEIEPLK